MINQYLANVMDKEKHREFERTQLVKIVERSQKDQAWQR